MQKLNRRQFVQSSVATCLLGVVELHPTASIGETSASGRSYRFTGANYVWEWFEEHDQFRILNQSAEVITRGPLQPVLILQKQGEATRHALAGKLLNHHAETDRASWSYGDEARSAKLTVALRFDPNGFWMEPIEYELSSDEDVVSLHWFAVSAGDAVRPSLGADNLVLPGICEG